MAVQSRRKRCQDVDLRGAEHPGLILDKWLTEAEHGGGEKPERMALLEAAQRCRASSALYEAAYNRWVTSFVPGPKRVGLTFEVEVEGRMILGLGEHSPLETGITLHHSYGVPVLSGSALKGVCRSWSRRRFGGLRPHTAVEGDHNERWGDDDGEGIERPVFAPDGELDLLLFGDDEGQGLITFHDGLFVPGSQPRPLAMDVMTPHHPGYYTKGKGAWPLDTDAPTPIHFLTVGRGVRFLISLEGPSMPWLEWVAKRLTEVLEEEGIGGKTRAGYGRLRQASPINKIELGKEASSDMKVFLGLWSAVFDNGPDLEQRFRAEMGIGGRFKVAQEELEMYATCLEDPEESQEAMKMLYRGVMGHGKLKKRYGDWVKALRDG